MDKSIIYVSGLPRSGSTLLCQLLAHHPDVYSNSHSSPLATMLNNLRYSVSDNEFLLSQLDVDFDGVYAQLMAACRGMINGWTSTTEKPYFVDKNRVWLRMVEKLFDIDPDFKMIVCIRDIRQIFGSIETQHRKTRLLDFPDHMDPHSAYSRAEKLLIPEGVIGSPLKSIEQMQDIEDSRLKKRICYLLFESLIYQPEQTMDSLFEFCELPKVDIDFSNLTVMPHESDSYYRFKYPHGTYSTLSDKSNHQIPQRISQRIEQDYQWFYSQFYPTAIEYQNNN